MPLLKGTATFSRYRVETPASSASDKKRGPPDIAKALKLRAFQPLERGGEDERAQGFVELADKNRSEFSPGATYEGPFALFSYRVDEVRIPSAAIKSELEAWQQKFVSENGRPPGKKEKGDAKEEIRHTLKSRYPIATKTFDVSMNLETGHAQLWAGSRKAVDELQDAVEQALGVKLVPVSPLTIAQQLGIAEKSLTPTPALSMPEGEA
jgi:DNA recombination-dependent growth factor C